MRRLDLTGLAILASCSTLLMMGCPEGLQRPPEGVASDPCPSIAASEAAPDAPLGLEALANWQRCDGPVLRDPVPGYEVASDGHVFRDAEGTLRMIYSGDLDDQITPKLATGQDWDQWTRQGPLFAPAQEGDPDRFKETPFYRLAEDGTHQIFYIGYPTEEAYEAQIYLAESDRLEGPYERRAGPVIVRGQQAGHKVYLMSSPSVVEHEGELLMTYLAWDDDPDSVTEVWVMGARSVDDGRTWTDIQEVDAPVGMEGQITPGPDGLYYATSMHGWEDTEAIFLARAEHPFGPYETLEEPALIKAGAPWEVHEANAPQLAFDPNTRTAYLYYVGASYLYGWWVLMAQTRY